MWLIAFVSDLTAAIHLAVWIFLGQWMCHRRLCRRSDTSDHAKVSSSVVVAEVQSESSDDEVDTNLKGREKKDGKRVYAMDLDSKASEGNQGSEAKGRNGKPRLDVTQAAKPATRAVYRSGTDATGAAGGTLGSRYRSATAASSRGNRNATPNDTRADNDDNVNDDNVDDLNHTNGNSDNSDSYGFFTKFKRLLASVASGVNSDTVKHCGAYRWTCTTVSTHHSSAVGATVATSDTSSDDSLVRSTQAVALLALVVRFAALIIIIFVSLLASRRMMFPPGRKEPESNSDLTDVRFRGAINGTPHAVNSQGSPSGVAKELAKYSILRCIL
jgi:hypothetical protein